MTPKWRGILGPAYPLLMRLKTGPLMHNAKAGLGYLPWLLERHASASRLVVDMASPIGMGAVLSYLLRFHAYAEDHGIDAEFISKSPLYASGSDFLVEYFEKPAPLAGAHILSRTAAAWLWQKEIPATIPLERAAALFEKHAKPNRMLRNVLDAATGGFSHFDLSVHFRGNDKFLETGRTDIRLMFDALDNHLPGNGAGTTVFLATDDDTFRRAIKERFPLSRYVSFDLGEVLDGVPRHFSNLSPNDKAIEALVNILLLARAPVCVRTMSFLSSMSKIASPQLRTQTVNWGQARGLPFPEDRLREEEMK